MLIHLQPHILLFGRTKALRLNMNRVIPDRQQGHEVVPAIVGFGLTRQACALCGSLHAGSGNYRTRLVRYGAGKAPRRLSIQKRTDGKYK